MLAMAMPSASSRLKFSPDCDAIKTLTPLDTAASKPFINRPLMFGRAPNQIRLIRASGKLGP